MSETASKSMNTLVAAAERATGPQFPEPSSPLFSRIKRLPDLLPWQREMVPWAFGAVEYGERYWSQARELRRWQLATYAGWLTAMGLAVCLVSLARRPGAVPYIVETDKHNYVVAIEPAEEASPSDERVVMASVAKWVRSMHTVLGDAKAQRALVDDTYSMLAQGTPAFDKANKWFRAHNPFEAGTKRVDVQISRVAPMRSATALTIEWTELARDGGATSVSRWSAYVEIKVSPVQKLDDVLANPLGIFITDYSVTQLQ